MEQYNDNNNKIIKNETKNLKKPVRFVVKKIENNNVEVQKDNQTNQKKMKNEINNNNDNYSISPVSFLTLG